MMHDEFRLKLHAYADNELDAGEALAIEAHLEGCADCRAEFEALRDLKRTLADADWSEDLPADLTVNIRKSLRKTSGHNSLINQGPLMKWRLPAGGLIAAGLAAMLVLAPRPSAPVIPPVTDELVSSHIRSLMGSHLVDVVSSDHHTVKPWFDGKIDFAPPVLAKVGDCALTGGRLDYVSHQTAAAMAYRCGAHVVNFYAVPNEGRPETAATDPQLATLRGYHVVSWQRGKLDCYAVSDMSDDKLLDFARFIEAHAREG